MGGTSWSESEYSSRAYLRSARSEPTFLYHHAVATGASPRVAHEKMNPLHAKADPSGVKMRESRDSEAHPTTTAVAILMDVTGSMNKLPKILQSHLPKLMGLLISKGYLEHPQILIGAIGDAKSDSAPLQIGQFESGIEIEEDLQKLFLEAGGGGGYCESYELGLYWLAKHTSIDCWEKRKHKGYVFVIGDEAPYPEVRRSEVLRLIGDTLQEDFKTADVVKELKERYDVYAIHPREGDKGGIDECLSPWRALLSQNVIILDDVNNICETIAGAIGLAEGATDLTSLPEELADVGSAGAAAAVSTALAPLSKGGKAAVATIPDSGPGSGLTPV